jgi:prepilin-type N-terminal cleavage/methylation domain-containing protein
VKRGFTLIELLVVMSIISILSSIALASLSEAKKSAKDVSVKSQLAALRAQGDLYLSSNGSYLSICNSAFANHGFGGINGPGPLSYLLKTAPINKVGSTVEINSTNGFWHNVYCNDDPLPAGSGRGWAVEVPSKKAATDVVRMWCADSTGTLRLQNPNVTLQGAFVCP